MSMAKRYERTISIIKLVYEIKYENVISIFHPYFVKKNKSKCKMLINNKLHLLTDKYRIVHKKMKSLKIKLLVFNNIKISLSYMFYNCKSLKEFKIISQEKDDFHYSKEQLSRSISNIDKHDINIIFNKALKIYEVNKWFEENSEKEKKNVVINMNLDFSLNSDSTIESNNICNSEHSQLIEKSFSFNSWKTIGLNINEKFKFHECYIIATNLSYMFYNCSSLLSITGLSRLYTINVTNMAYMFYDCRLLQKIFDISKWGINMVKDMNNMFACCSSLKSLPNISKWNTGNVIDMNGVFRGCSSLISLPDISK